MAKGYSIKTKYHTHNPEKAKDLISGGGVLQAIKDSIEALHKKIDHPFNLLDYCPDLIDPKTFYHWAS